MKLLMITDCSFPYNSAMASRLKAFCRIFNTIGYSVHVISAKTDNKDIIYGKTYIEDFYEYEIIKSKRSHKLQSYIGNENIYSSIKNYLKNNKVDLVFMTSLGANFAKIYSLCRETKIKIILEQSEWYDYSSYRFKKLDPRFIRFSYNIKKRFVKVDGVIAISRLLENYYKSKNVNVIKIPTILDVDNRKHIIDKQYERKLVFTGNASKSKELLKPILQALANSNYSNKISFDIYGLNKKQVLSNIGNDIELFNKVEPFLNIFGFINQSEIENKIANSDYQIFVRPNRLSSNAGFPTKLGESMSVGTPVITNDTGDIGLYLKDGYNGYLLDGNTSNSVAKAFSRLLDLSNHDYSKLRKNALETAKNNFHYKIYVEDINEFISRI